MKMLPIAAALVATAAVSLSQEVYVRGYAPGWRLSPWANTTVEPVTDGARPALAVRVLERYGRLYVQAPNGFLTGNQEAGQTLSFSLRADEKAVGNLFVGLYRADGKPFRNVPLAMLVTASEPGGWKRVEMPVSALGATNQVVLGVVIESGEAGAFSVANVSFSPAPRSRVLPFTAESMGVKCDPGPEEPSENCSSTVVGSDGANRWVVWTAKQGPVEVSGEHVFPADARTTTSIVLANAQEPEKSKSVTVASEPEKKR